MRTGIDPIQDHQCIRARDCVFLAVWIIRSASNNANLSFLSFCSSLFFTFTTRILFRRRFLCTHLKEMSTWGTITPHLDNCCLVQGLSLAEVTLVKSLAAVKRERRKKALFSSHSVEKQQHQLLPLKHSQPNFLLSLLFFFFSISYSSTMGSRGGNLQREVSTTSKSQSSIDTRLLKPTSTTSTPSNPSLLLSKSPTLLPQVGSGSETGTVQQVSESELEPWSRF